MRSCFLVYKWRLEYLLKLFFVNFPWNTGDIEKPSVQILIALLIFSPLVLGVPLQRTTRSTASHVLRGWIPNACTLVICGPAETNPKGLPETQEIWGPTELSNILQSQAHKGSADSESEKLKTQMREIQMQLDDFKVMTTKIQKAVLTPNGVIVGKKLFKTDGTMGDYDAGRISCSHMDGTLASPRNAEENNAIQQIVTWHNKRAVLGITDMTTENRFVYLDGQVAEYTNWAPGEPNDIGNEDCVEMHPDGKWHDRTCGFGWLIICEFSLA